MGNWVRGEPLSMRLLHKDGDTFRTEHCGKLSIRALSGTKPRVEFLMFITTLPRLIEVCVGYGNDLWLRND